MQNYIPNMGDIETGKPYDRKTLVSIEVLLFSET